MANTFNFFVAKLVLVALTTVSSTDATVCSEAVPSDDQICVTIKFPWQFEAVHFCTDRANIDYVSQCPTPEKSRFCYDDGRNDTLKIATPWDCCPIISTPNHCHSVSCPPKPYNRKCKSIRTPGKCCPTYFCEEGTIEQCHAVRLDEGCYRNVQMEEMNCTTFEDPYGCCNKYQCKEDEKPGECPKTAWANWFHSSEVPATSAHHHHHHHHHTQDRSDSESSSFSFKGMVKSAVRTARTAVRQGARSFKNYLKTQGGFIGQAVSEYVPFTTYTEEQGQRRHPVQRNQDVAARTLVGARNMFHNVAAKRTKSIQSKIRCVGDSTCPGDLKCCPIFNTGNGVVQGYCLEAVGVVGSATAKDVVETPSGEEYQSEQGVYIRGYQADHDKYEHVPEESNV